MRQHLNSPFRHHAGLDAGDGEGRGGGAGFGIDRALHVHEFAHAKSVGRKPPVRLGRIGDGKGGKMQPGMARQARHRTRG